MKEVTPCRRMDYFCMDTDRIGAYRLGIDLAQVEAWVSGEQDGVRFQDLIRLHRRRKYQMQLRRAAQFRGQQSYEMRLAAERDLAQQYSQ